MSTIVKNDADTGDVNSTFVLETFHRLLADVRMQSGVSFKDAPVVSYSWVSKKAPELDKKILMFLEHEAHFTPSFWRDDRSDTLPDQLKYGPLYLQVKEDMPEWLSPLWERFLEKGSPFMLRLIRTVLLFCYKVEHEPTNEQIHDAQYAFEETDRMCEIWAAHFRCSKPTDHAYTIARRLIGSVVYRIRWEEMTPQHGPGGCYPASKPCDKSRFTTLYQKIVEKFPYDQYFCALPSFWVDTMVHEHSGELREDPMVVAKLVCVPKDSRGPRLICVHPKEAIWIQLGLAKQLEAHISSNPLTKGRINFTDQTVNANIALLSSKSQRFTTLDLKEASDRISCELVRHLFGDWLYAIISCARAECIKLLDGRVIPLQKWAPMGNGLTFPVQSLVFWSLVRAGISTHYGVSCDEVYVFGDDIAFPSEYTDGAIKGLVTAGLVPNMAKTFSKGFFRESCGTDAFKGVSVTPLRMRAGNIVTLKHIVSNLSLAKRLRQAGYEQCASFLYRQVRHVLAKRSAIQLQITNNPDCEALTEYRNISFAELLKVNPRVVFNKKIHQWGQRAYLVSGKLMRPAMHDWYHVQDSLLSLSRNRAEIRDRGTEYPIPYRIQLKYGWTSCHLK